METTYLEVSLDTVLNHYINSYKVTSKNKVLERHMCKAYVDNGKRMVIVKLVTTEKEPHEN